MIKTLLVLVGGVLLAVPAIQAQQQHRYYGNGGRLADRASYGRYHGGYAYGGHHHGGRYYYFGGVPYFYPFIGFGYPGYYGGWYGDGFAGSYGYGDAGAYPGGPYEGRIADDGNGSDRNAPPANGSGPSLPQAVQRQLAKKGFYKGEIDGQFGPASRAALSRFQREHNLRETGRIDEPTLDALGFTDRAPGERD